MGYICVHGHFYQPPRENPWLEAVELQDSAYPYHDWNERITAECYAPNGASRILTSEGKVNKIANNYQRISFNFGPTLLSWMKTASPETYRNIIDGDKQSRQRFGGHGTAIAQAYSHMILPLANTRDKRTQMIWGSARFRKSLRPSAGGYVAAGDSCRPGIAGHSGATRNPVHYSEPGAGGTRSQNQRPQLDRRVRCTG